MVNCGTLWRSALVAVVLVAVIPSGSAVNKLSSCCNTVSRQVITEPITGYLVQRASSTCVRAVIFQTEKGLFCSHVNAPWVRRKIIAFQKAKALASLSSAAPSSTVSLLSLITSTASPSSTSSSSSSLPPSSASLPPSFPSTSEMPAYATSSGQPDE